MKNRKSTRRSPSKKSAGGTLIGLFVGLVIGVVGAAMIVWYIQRTPPPFSNTPATSQRSQDAAPISLPSKPGDTASERRFDFYEILSGKNGPAPPPSDTDTPHTDNTAQDPSRTAAVDDKAKPADTPSGNIYLQTGSFQNAADADNQRARLAMMGIEATVQQAMLQEKVWYRVRIGPFDKAEDTASLRAELAKSNINAAVVK